MQEIEIENDFDCDLLNIPGYRFECERRVWSYIKNSIKYDRCNVLEGENNHLLIIDIENGLKKKKRIIYIYRSFNPNGLSERDLFERQLTVMKNAFNGYVSHKVWSWICNSTWNGAWAWGRIRLQVLMQVFSKILRMWRWKDLNKTFWTKTFPSKMKMSTLTKTYFFPRKIIWNLSSDFFWHKLN